MPSDRNHGGRSGTKRKIRSLERAAKGLPADSEKRCGLEKRIEELRSEREGNLTALKNKKIGLRYRGIMFIEKQKLLKRLKKVENREANDDEVGFSDADVGTNAQDIPDPSGSLHSHRVRAVLPIAASDTDVIVIRPSSTVI